MAWKVLVSAPYFQPVIDQYEALFAEHDIELVLPSVNERMSEAELLAVISDIDGVISGDDRFTAAVFQKAAKLKVISKWGTGIDSIDQAAAAKYGVRVKNTPNAFTDPVSDTVMGYILCFARQLPWMDRDIRMGLWRKRPGVALQECALGVIGVGKIGQAVMRKAKAFGMRILGNDIRSIDQEFLDEVGGAMVSKEQLLAEADFVSLNCTYNETSHHIIDDDALERMQDQAYLINTARGPLIDEDSLVRALQAEQIAGAALDVFEEEPVAKQSLIQFENCLFAPHNSNSSPSAWERVHANTLNNLLEVLLNSSKSEQSENSTTTD